MFGRKSLLSFVILAAVFLQACAATIRVPMTRPARVNLSKFKTVAVSDIDGNGGNNIGDLLTTALFNSGRFTVLDRAKLKTILEEQGLGVSGAVAENTSVQLGQMYGASAMIFGRVSERNFNDEDVKESKHTDKNGYTHVRYTRKGYASMIVSLRVTDLTTGQIIATESLSKKATFQVDSSGSMMYTDDTDTVGSSIMKGLLQGMATGIVSGLEESSAKGNTVAAIPPHVDPASVFEKLQQDVIANFMKMIVGYTEVIDVEIQEIPQNKNAVIGINKLKLLQWKDALADFQKALEEIKSDPKLNKDAQTIAKVLYNIGICYSYMGEYDLGLKYLQDAYAQSPKDVYSREISRCKTYRVENQKLKEQGLVSHLWFRPVVIKIASAN